MIDESLKARRGIRLVLQPHGKHLVLLHEHRCSEFSLNNGKMDLTEVGQLISPRCKDVAAFYKKLSAYKNRLM